MLYLILFYILTLSKLLTLGQMQASLFGSRSPTSMRTGVGLLKWDFLSLFLAQHFLGVLAIGNDVYAGLLWPFINSQFALPFGRFASDRRNTCRRDATVAG